MTAAKPKLSLVPAEQAAPYDEQKGRKRIAMLREQLLRASLKYIAEGKTDSPQQRLRDVSDMSGIPRALLEAKK